MTLWPLFVPSSERPAEGGVGDEFGLWIGGDAHLVVGVATEEPDVGGVLRMKEADVAAAGLIHGEGLQDADGAVGGDDRAAPAPPVGNFGAAAWLVARVLHAPVHKSGAPGGFIVQEAAADAAAAQILEDAGIVRRSGPLLHADFHDGDLHPWRRCGKMRGCSRSEVRRRVVPATVDGHDLAGKQDLPFPRTPIHQRGVQLLKPIQCHAERIRDVSGVVSGLNDVLGHGVGSLPQCGREFKWQRDRDERGQVPGKESTDCCAEG